MSVLIIVLWTISYFSNESRLTQINEHLAVFYETSQPLSHQQNYHEKETLAALKEIYQSSQVYRVDQDDIPNNIQYGLYQGDNLTELNNAYFQQLNQLLIPAISQRLLAQMNNHQDNSELLYQSLKAYLMLGTTQRLDKEFMKQWMLLDWQQRYQDSIVIEELTIHFDNALNHLSEITLDKPHVEKIRALLLQVPLAEQVYLRLKQEAKGQGEDYSFTKDIGSHLHNVFIGTDKIIPWLYTKAGYQTYFQKNSAAFIKEFLQDDWVLNTRYTEFTIENFKSFYNDVETLYMKDYIHYWDQALMTIKVKSFQSFDQFVQLLDVISGEKQPFKQILAETKENTLLSAFNLSAINTLPNISGLKGGKALLDILPSSLSAKAYRLKKVMDTGSQIAELNAETLKKVQEKEQINLLEHHFSAIHNTFQFDPVSSALMTQVQEELTQLLNVLNKINLSEDKQEAIFIQVKRYLKGEGFDSQLELLAQRSPEPLKSWIHQLRTNIWSVALNNTGQYINQQYQNKVYSFYKERLINRYPLFKAQKEDIMLSDFISFFKPKGIEHQFFIDYIQPFLYIRGDSWKEREISGTHINFPDEYLQQLKRAALIRQVIFRDGPKPDINFSIKMNSASKKVDKFGFQLDNQKASFSQKTLFKVKQYHWPSAQNFGRVAIFVLIKSRGQVKNRDQIGIAKSGPWSVFRLLDALQVMPIEGTNFLNVDAKFKKYQVNFQLMPNTNSAINPFSQDLLQTYRCLDNI
jgi:type VI secretion system protein ImpL